MKRIACLIAVSFCVLLSGCVVFTTRPGMSAPKEPVPIAAAVSEAALSSAPAADRAPLGLDEQMVRKITQLMKNAASGETQPEKKIGMLIEEYDGFTCYPSLQMLMYEGLESDIYRYDRINRFFENHKAGVADELGIIKSGEPIPCYVVHLATDGTTILARTVWNDQFEEPHQVALTETETEWILLGGSGQMTLRYAKYGLVPVLIDGEPRPVTQEEASAALSAWVLDGGMSWVEATQYPLDYLGDDVVCGQECYRFVAQEDFMGEAYCVAKDLSFLCYVEQVNGNYAMKLTPARSEEHAQTANIPSGPIVRMRE